VYPVRVVIPFPAAGTGETVTRMLSDALDPTLGHQPMVKDKPGKLKFGCSDDGSSMHSTGARYRKMSASKMTQLPVALANLSRMERGDIWTQYDHMAGVTAHLTVALDRERIAVARAFGLTVRSIKQHFHHSFGAPMIDFSDQCRWVPANLGSPNGPATLDTRYITEDVPYGLVFNARMARLAGMPAPITEGCIALAGAAYGRDFNQANDLLEAIAPETLGPAGLRAALA